MTGAVTGGAEGATAGGTAEVTAEATVAAAEEATEEEATRWGEGRMPGQFLIMSSAFCPQGGVIVEIWCEM